MANEREPIIVKQNAKEIVALAKRRAKEGLSIDKYCEHQTIRSH